MGDGEGKPPEGLPCCCICHQFAAAASRNPSGTAVLHASAGTRCFSGESSSPSLSPPPFDGDASFTYSQVSLAVHTIAARLRAVFRGEDAPGLVRPSSGKMHDCGGEAQRVPSFSFVPNDPLLAESGDMYKPKIVGIYMPPSAEYVVSVLSVFRCGEAFLPLDPWWPRDRILSVVSSSNVDAILASRLSFGTDDLSDWIAESVSCPVLFFSMDECLQEGRDLGDTCFPCQFGKQRLFCYLMYTSGSTGKPKGVCGTEKGLLNRFLWMQEFYPFQVEEYILFKTSICFIDHLQEILGSILTASTLVVPPFNELKVNILSILDFLEAYRISRLTAVPSLMRAVLPALQSQHHLQLAKSLKLLVLSGEVFSVSLWKMLSTVFPTTLILNLYGSTEVSGDCTFFDCQKLPRLLETETLINVPIGQPISNCEVVLGGERGIPDEGEIYVGGPCISSGLFVDSTFAHSDFIAVPWHSSLHCSDNKPRYRLFYRTGDFACQLQDGNLVFIGRKDRLVKISGQRISLEEVEDALRGHGDVVDAAVLSHKGGEEHIFLIAFLLLRKMGNNKEALERIRHWAIAKLPAVMIPHDFIILETFPMTTTGKVDYDTLVALGRMRKKTESHQTEGIDTLQAIKKAFLDALMIETVSDEDNFFAIGGNSITAAHVSYNLGIKMALLYDYPCPNKLYHAILQQFGSYSENMIVDSKRKTLQWHNPEGVEMGNPRANVGLIENSGSNGDLDSTYKRLKADDDVYSTNDGISPSGYFWTFLPELSSCCLSRCNRIMYGQDYVLPVVHQASWSSEVPRNTKMFIRKLWKVPMGSCVDASPLLVMRNEEIFIFIGAHSQKFSCINAKSGSVQWEIKLDGRIEGSALITDDFSQVVVGSYDGKIYFIDFSCGKLCWTFQTAGEVKSQPVFDKRKQLFWCGSYDRIIYALDYRSKQCVYQATCGGSIYGTPAIDEVNNRLFVASTNGCITALSIKALPFYVSWQCDLGVPAFGSMAICPISGNVICCLVDGYVVALDLSGSFSWKTKVDGPIFAGASLTSTLPSQVLICSRSGKVYSLHTENGNIKWKYDVGEPITASVYVDEHLQLVHDRLVCICTCSGSVVILRINMDVEGYTITKNDQMLQEFARLKLDGDIFSSPVMIGGQIFVGCRDDYIHCLMLHNSQ